VRGDEHRAAGRLREDQAGDEVGEALAHAGAGFGEEDVVVEEGAGDVEGHALLLRAVLQRKGVLEPAALGEGSGDELQPLVGRRGRTAEALMQADHRDGERRELRDWRRADMAGT
jgi:hypothetical protein